MRAALRAADGIGARGAHRARGRAAAAPTRRRRVAHVGEGRGASAARASTRPWAGSRSSKSDRSNRSRGIDECTAERRDRASWSGGARRAVEFIARGGAAAGGLALGSTLLGATRRVRVASAARPTVGGQLSVLNWPLYIDKKSKKDFPAETGIDLKYSESLNDNNEFFAKYQRQLSQDQYPGFDIAVPTSWMAKRLIEPRLRAEAPARRHPERCQPVARASRTHPGTRRASTRCRGRRECRASRTTSRSRAAS